MITFALIGNIAQGNADDEIALMRRIQARDADALEELYDLYNQLLFSVVISIVKKREEAEELLQEIFIRIWEKADSFDADHTGVFNWIVTLARNRAINRIRSESVGDEPTFLLEGDEANPMKTTIFSDRAELVKKALDQIPEEQSEIIKIAYYRGMTQSGIAEYLNIPLDTVKTRTHQGMMKLKNILGEFISNNG